VEGIKPITNELEEVSYRVVDGVFKENFADLRQIVDPDNKYFDYYW
jgi:hypothetical protein